MKRLYFFTFFLISTLCHAQSYFSCNSVSESSENLITPFSEPVIPDPTQKFVINVFFHIVTDENGKINRGQGLIDNDYGEEEIMEAMRVLTKNFWRYNIYFKYRGHDVIADTNLTNNVTSNWTDYDVTGSFNLFFVNSLGGASGSALVGNILSSYAYWAMESYFERTIIHEIGHCFNLFHVFQPYTGGHPCEHVTRDVNDPSYNADAAGDKVADTAAHPNFGLGAAYFNNCVFQNPGATLADCEGTPYENIELNFMGIDVPDASCDMVLTPGQATRARTYLANLTAPHYLACLTTMDQLFLPYYDEIVASNHVVSTVDNGDGTITTCRQPKRVYRYQKGFYYTFKSSSILPQIIDFYSHELPVIFPIGPTLKVAIKESKHPQQTFLIPSINGVPPICETEPVSGVTIVSTQVLGSNNFTEKQLTAEEINDPAVYDNLAPGYYHCISKHTVKGTVFTKTVYIPN